MCSCSWCCRIDTDNNHNTTQQASTTTIILTSTINNQPRPHNNQPIQDSSSSLLSSPLPPLQMMKRNRPPPWKRRKRWWWTSHHLLLSSSSSALPSSLVWYGVTIILLLLSLSSSVDAISSLTSSTTSSTNSSTTSSTTNIMDIKNPHVHMTPEVVCSSIEVRNSVKSLIERLQNCTVVEGYLQIALFEKTTPKDWANLSFPRLTEITDYLMFYGVSGLQSIGKLFPNLAVIRGQVVFQNYALIIYELRDLTEIDLRNLITIERGAVRIEKNPSLCYSDTIDWDQIATSKFERQKKWKRSHVIRDNKERYACRPCHESCPKGKPTIWSSLVPTSAPEELREQEPLCWTHDRCQRVCHSNCTDKGLSCLPDNASACCPFACLGGCVNNVDNKFSTPSSIVHCIACRGIQYRGQCHDLCPARAQLLEFKSRRCIEHKDCDRMSIKKEDGTLSIFKSRGTSGKCLPECPDKYDDDPNDPAKCVVCKNFKCPKTCQGDVTITSISDAKKLTGCTKINGSLAISVRGGDDIVSQLEESLKDVQIITGYLKVTRSHPLVSLHFFKSLRTIEGNFLDRLNYSLLIYDNPNLKELFDWNHTLSSISPTTKMEEVKTIEIKQGKPYFHTNPKLCMSKIEELKRFTNIDHWIDTDVSSTSNGDKAACNVKTLNISVTSITHRSAQINWDNFLKYLHDPRLLVEYVIYYRETLVNVTKYDGQDACKNREWQMATLEVVDQSKDPTVFQILPHLNPFTRYAVYVTTYMVSHASQGGETDIVYFRTLPTTPEKVNLARGAALSETSVQLIWQNTAHPNGNVTYYRIKVIPREESEEIGRDWCEYPAVNQYNRPPVNTHDLKEMLDQVPHNGKHTNGDDASPLINPLLSNGHRNGKGGSHLHQGVSNEEINQCYNTCKRDKTVHRVDEELSEKSEFEDIIMDHTFVRSNSKPTSGSTPLVEGNNRSKRFTDEAVTNEDEPDDNEVASDNRRYGSLTGHNVWTTPLPPNLTTMNSVTDEDLVTSLTSSESNDTQDSISDNSTTVVTPMPKRPKKKLEPFELQIPVNSSVEFESTEIHNLTHFTFYDIQIQACQADDNLSRSEDVRCSSRTEHAYILTLPSKTADIITDVEVEVSTSPASTTATDGNGTSTLAFNDVIIRFSEPEDPNGAIRSFQVAYYKAESSFDSKSTPQTCVLYADYKKNDNSVILRDIPPGEYKLMVRASSLAGPGNWSEERSFTIVDTNQMSVWMIILLCFIGLTCIVLFSALSSWVILKKNRQTIPSVLEYVSMNPEYMPAYEPDDWEIERDRVEVYIHEELGKGGFGTVYGGHIVNLKPGVEKTPCAVKMVKTSASPRAKLEFLNEASVMKAFDCHHVVKLLGVVSIGSPTLVCMEYMPLKDLKNYLKSCRDDYEGDLPKRTMPTKPEVHLMSCQIADGMAYLASKKYVHRDLASRNCLLAADKTVKLGDFGMTRDIYEADYYRMAGKKELPIRWMAPESIKDGLFDSQSDVWSFGVVLWEIVTLAEQPYRGLGNDQVCKYIMGGGTIDRPENCPEDLWTTMHMCWSWKAKSRPTFGELIDMLYGAIEDAKKPQFESHSFYLEEKNLAVQSSASAIVAVEGTDGEEMIPLNPTREKCGDKENSRGSGGGSAKGAVGGRDNSGSDENKGSKESAIRFLPSIITSTFNKIPFFGVSSFGTSSSSGHRGSTASSDSPPTATGSATIDFNGEPGLNGTSVVSYRTTSTTSRNSTSTARTVLSFPNSTPVGETSFLGDAEDREHLQFDDTLDTTVPFSSPGSHQNSPPTRNGTSGNNLVVVNGFQEESSSRDVSSHERNNHSGNGSIHHHENSNSNGGIPGAGGGGSKENSKTSVHSTSDGSKGSKVSNGSVVNGWNPHSKTSIC